MTIDDQIKSEKLQYDINRETAKISSGKFDKYEYLTGEEILPSNKQQIIEQAKFTYSPLGKVFEKQTKTIEDQGEKQIKAIQDNKQLQLTNDYDYKDKLLISREIEIFKDIYNKRLDKIEELNNRIDYDNLKYVVEKSGVKKDSTEYDIKKGKISIQEAKDKQENYYNYLKKIRKGNKSANQKRTLANINILFNARDNAIKFYEDYSSMIFEAIEKEGEGLKILTPNQMLKRLSIALAQIKAGKSDQLFITCIDQKSLLKCCITI